MRNRNTTANPNQQVERGRFNNWMCAQNYRCLPEKLIMFFLKDNFLYFGTPRQLRFRQRSNHSARSYPWMRPEELCIAKIAG
jgi:hypothetical protein